MAKLFIGIPTWNRTVFVKEAIESVRSQGISDIRLLVSDNCSEPKVSDVIETFIEQLDDPRVTFIRQPKNRGQNGQIEYFLDQCADEEFFAPTAIPKIVLSPAQQDAQQRLLLSLCPHAICAIA